MQAKRSTLEDVLVSIRQANRFLITSHARPDGDAVGSVLACWMIFQALGKSAEIAFSDPVPPLYRSLPYSSRICQWGRVDGSYDAILLLECDSIERTRMDGLGNHFLINIDHHATSRLFADVNWIDARACAVGEMIYHLAAGAGVPITPEMATCLYTAILTDTGSFCYEGTDAHTFELAGDLVRRGADPALIAQNVYFSNRPSKMGLLGIALSNLHCDGRLAWLWVTGEDMNHTGATEEDCEGIVNYAIAVQGIDLAAFFRELPDRSIRVSLRSKGRIDVASVAEQFGGGGHENASGCTLQAPFAVAIEHLLGYLRHAFPPNLRKEDLLKPTEPNLR